MSKTLEQAAQDFSDKYWSNLTDYEKISCFKAGAEFMQKEYEGKEAELNAKKILKKGDRVRCTKCPGTKRVFTFSHWDGCWMVSKSGINDYHPVNVDMVNGEKVYF